MSFLQPLLLSALPLISLPILIHLINRQRHRTIPWAAMMFLLDAKRLTRGMARLRYWLIMAMRMLAIATLVFAIARPLASGWVGLAMGGQPDTTILILDRSASMEQQDVQTGQSKRSTGLRKLSELIDVLGGSSSVVLIENTQNRAEPLDSVRSLAELSDTTATATSADLPGMLQTALDYVVATQSGRTDIWVCSDLRAHDWRAEDGRWGSIRAGFERLDGIRFYLLSYPDPAPENLSVRATNPRRRQIGQTAELVLDIQLRREPGAKGPQQVPLEFVINGARSVVTIEMHDQEHNLQGHSIALDEETLAGWGRVELPTDSNRQDNASYFVFADPPVHQTVIVSDDRRTAEPLRMAAISPADPALSYAATVLTSDTIDEIEWDETSLILWQAELPEGVIAQQLQHFASSGRPIIFFPPRTPGSRELFGATWGDWQQGLGSQPLPIASWRGDSDLLSHTRGGMPLPVGQLKLFQYCTINGGGNPLARLDGGYPWLTRSANDQGPVYFCATLPYAEYSSLAQDGVVFYVMIHRALSTGAMVQGKARQLAAGTEEANVVVDWEPLATSSELVLLSARPFQAGAYRHQDRLVALNRPPSEDQAGVLNDGALERLFSGLNYRKVEDRVGNRAALASEIWRAFLLAMAAALLLEAWLCLPERRVPSVEV